MGKHLKFASVVVDVPSRGTDRPFDYEIPEELADQERAVALCERLGGRNFEQAQHHRDIVRRFGRFPHRNAILGRPATPEEAAYLANGGYAG